MEAIAIGLFALGQYILWTKNIPELVKAWKRLRYCHHVIHLENCLDNQSNPIGEGNDQRDGLD